MAASNWKFWIDTGGTFTDCIAIDPEGARRRVKVLSNGCLRGRIIRKINPHVYHFEANWEYPSTLLEGYRFRIQGSGEKSKLLAINYRDKTLVVEDNLSSLNDTDFEISTGEEAPVLAARLITGTPFPGKLPLMEIRLGTTKGTNALLERKGAKTLLLVTKGFRDLLRIGTQQRPHLFQLNIPEPETLYESVREIDERLDSSGKVLSPLNRDFLRRVNTEAYEAVAVSLLHSYQNPAHEREVRDMLLHDGNEFISISSELAPAIHYLRRTQTTLINAYLTPVLSRYLQNIRKAVGNSAIQVMRSSGGLTDAGHFFAKDSLLSGPAGGVVAAAHLARQFGIQKLITFDMGGTSTDVSRIQGRPELKFITSVDGIELHNAALAIETVAAGGGSVCWFNEFNLCVGPESAGAFPGPACYGAGGPLTITDVNLLLGKLEPHKFGIPIRFEAAERALNILKEEVFRKTGHFLSARQVLLGLEAIANEKMADAIRRISVSRGIDPSDHTLLVFGGAGGLHGCQLAAILGIGRVIIPYDAGLFSAVGMGLARVSRIVARQVLIPWETTLPELETMIQQMESEGKDALLDQGVTNTCVEFCSVFLRFAGQEQPLEVPFSGQDTIPAFEKIYREHFGYFPEKGAIELESIRLGISESAHAAQMFEITDRGRAAVPARTLTARYHSEDETTIPVFEWNDLKGGALITGPAVLINESSSTYIPAGWEGIIQDSLDLALFHRSPGENNPAEKPEEVELELFTNRFMAIADEMGAQLQRTAFSVNVKERLDFSCALLDPEGELLVNAPHIPVHLGSLGVCARLVREYLPIGPGDVVITNHPEFGGSHLPDITLLAGVFSARNELLGYVINRAHHAEIGGMTPGSMPPDATTLLQEGVVILPQYLVRQGTVQWEAIRELFTSAPYPTRNYTENEADIIAALSALRKGTQQLLNLELEHGRSKLFKYMQLLKDRASAQLRSALLPYEGKVLKATEFLDDGHRINLRITIADGLMTIDFQGTSKTHPANLNANIAILYSAILYVLRLLIDKEIPLNEGLLRNVRVKLPPDTFLHPDFRSRSGNPPAVVGGNTEVSQRLVDTLLKAFGKVACNQGTMNNFLFGNDKFGYYETVGGGTGAGNGFSGRSGVHQHMTNTRITDTEEIERRYPVRLLEFGLRKGSGGKGKYHGGEGIVRTFEFLETLEVTLLGQHRHFMPFGLAGGGGGKTGKNLLFRRKGGWIQLPGVTKVTVGPRDRITIKTPGGGAYGEADPEKEDAV